MAKTYAPSIARNVREEAKYIARYDAVITAALTLLSPEALAAYVAYKNAVYALNTFYSDIIPLLP